MGMYFICYNKSIFHIKLIFPKSQYMVLQELFSAGLLFPIKVFFPIWGKMSRLPLIHTDYYYGMCSYRARKTLVDHDVSASKVVLTPDKYVTYQTPEVGNDLKWFHLMY